MENKNNVKVSLDFSFGTMLQIVFIVLKLTNVIAWSWVWVLAPTWIGFGIVGLAIIGLSVYKIIKGIQERSSGK